MCICGVCKKIRDSLIIFLRFCGKILLTILAIGFFFVGIYATYMSAPSAAGITCAYGTAIALLWVTWLPEVGISELVLGNFRIKWQEKIKEAVSNLAVELTKLALINTYRPSAWRQQKITAEESIKIIPVVMEQLDKIGVSKEEQEKILLDFHVNNILNLSTPIIDSIRKFYIGKLQEINAKRSFGMDANSTEFKTLNEEYNMYTEEYSEFNKQCREEDDYFKSYELLNNFLNGCLSWNLPEKEKLKRDNLDSLENLEYYIKNRQFKK